MNYIVNSKNRKLKYKLHLLLNRLSFNFLNLSAPQKVTLLWIIISLISLFLTWFTYQYDKLVSNTAFSIRCWYVGYFVLFVLLFVTFVLLSNQNKETLKSKIHLIFHDYTIIIFSWIVILILSIVMFNTISWMSFISQNINTWNWIIFEIIGSIFIIWWWVLSYKEKKNEILSRTYIENSKFEAEKDLNEYKDILNSWPNNSDLNMKFPI